jgi:Asp-tRNA(Asn)/Glu-tRNA(Gln) amidotransferase A subunit family amidase
MRPVTSLVSLLTALSATAVVADNSQSQGAFPSGGKKFEPREATISSVHDALFSGKASCRDIVSSFLSRIEKYNSAVNAIITLNPNVLSTADQMDQSLKDTKLTVEGQPLFCVPIFLKDNYDTADIITTGGCADLNASRPTIDAITVTALRKAGAVILGKTNMHELALEGLSVSSAGGQTLNPYDLTRTPGGSSGGTGVAVAASLAVLGTGSDTVNSLRSPASANNLFSIRSTHGLISRTGIIPISYTQDIAGPIARSVPDLAAALTVMASVGYDPTDNTTALVPPSSVGVDYTKVLDGPSLKGMRFGLIETFFNRTATNETTPVNNAMDKMVSSLESAGAIVVPINESIYDANTLSANLDVQSLEYREALTAYLQGQNMSGTHPASFQELYSSGKFLVIPSQYSFIKTSAVSSTSNSSYFVKQRGIQNLIISLDTTFRVNKLDALIYPEQKNLVVPVGSPGQSGRNGILGALTGSPVVTVPAGFSPPSGAAPIGIPIGMEILGLPWTEPKLLNIAARIDELLHLRQMPKLTEGSVQTQNFTTVPVIIPDTKNIPSAYPLGVL